MFMGNRRESTGRGSDETNEDDPGDGMRRPRNDELRGPLVSIENRLQLEEYLAGLEARARERGRATASEVEPGFQAIALLESQLGAEATWKIRAAFSRRMVAISRRPVQSQGGDR